MERLAPQRPSGIGRNALRIWGILFLVAEVVSGAVLQNRILGLGSVSPGQLLESMQSSQNVMTIATIALVLKVLGACAVPVFAFLMVEGVVHTSSFQAYFLRVLGVAALSEIPYNLAFSGKLVDLSSRNPAFGLVVAMVMLFFFRRFSEKKASNVLVRIVVAVAAVLWCAMLSIEQGGPVVCVAAVLWLLWKKPMLRNLAGASVLMLCSMFSLFQMAAPMAFLAIHNYNGEQGEENRLLNYLAYPAILVLAFAAGEILA